jgi:hypothetical protein
MEFYYFLAPISEDDLAAVVVRLSEGIVEFKCFLKGPKRVFRNFLVDDSSFEDDLMPLPNVDLTDEELGFVAEFLKGFLLHPEEVGE